MDLLEAPTFILRQAALSATPLLLAGFGELIAQRAGIINVGIEGMILMGAIAAFTAAVSTGSAAAAIPAAILIGLLFGALFALAVVWCRADQIVTGTALNLLAAGASTAAWRILQNHTPAHLLNDPPHFNPLPIPILSQIPLLGPALFNQYALFYLVILLGIALYLLTTRTRLGLIIRALGDAPDAANAAGIRVRLWRTAILLLAGAAAGLAGAYLSTMRTHSFQINMSAGQGFLVLALVIFGRWSLPAFTAATLAFSALDGLQSLLAGIDGATRIVPHQIFDIIPYAATLIALALLTRNRTSGTNGPIHLGRPWPET